MKVLLIQDVYKLGHAGDVKKVADGYGRNYLIPQGLAVLATSGALKNADRIRADGAEKRATLNEELSGVAQRLSEITLTFPAKAGEGDKLYGSITHRMVAEELTRESGEEISHKQIDSQPIRTIGVHPVNVRLTVDLVPELKVVVYREGETAQMVLDAAEAAEKAEEAAEELEMEEEALPEAGLEDDDELALTPDEPEDDAEATPVEADEEALQEEPDEALETDEV